MSGRISNSNNYKQVKVLTEDLKGYNGKKKVIELLSGYEIKAVRMIQQMVTLDRIQGWNSEESIFPYYFTLDNKMHRYLMDFTLEMKDKVYFVEVKPSSQTNPPKRPKEFKNEKGKVNYQKRLAEYIKNKDKWTAVQEWCKNKNNEVGYNKYHFIIWTEHTLSI